IRKTTNVSQFDWFQKSEFLPGFGEFSFPTSLCILIDVFFYLHLFCHEVDAGRSFSKRPPVLFAIVTNQFEIRILIAKLVGPKTISPMEVVNAQISFLYENPKLRRDINATIFIFR